MSHHLDFTSPPQTIPNLLTFLQPSCFHRLTTMSLYPKWPITSSLQNVNESQQELHLSVVAALLSRFDFKLRATKSRARSARHSHLVPVSHTITVPITWACASPLPCHGSGAMQAEESTGCKGSSARGSWWPRAAVPTLCPKGNSREHTTASLDKTPAWKVTVFPWCAAQQWIQTGFSRDLLKWSL